LPHNTADDVVLIYEYSSDRSSDDDSPEIDREDRVLTMSSDEYIVVDRLDEAQEKYYPEKWQ
jgi:hypothetical protein